jgi:sodium-dependent dicarboxylate transporter 2/3/5
MRTFVREQRNGLGAWTRGQRGTLIAFLVAVTLWILPGVLQVISSISGSAVLAPMQKWFEQRLPEGVVAILAAMLLFALPTDLRRGRFVLSWPDAVRIDWGTILLFGGGLALGGLMFTTGVARALGEGLTATLGVESLWMLTGLSIVIAIVMSEAASNTASATMIIPVVIAIAQGAGVSAIPPALGACLGASYGFMLPVSTPPNAIVYGSGLIPLPSMMRAGVLFDVVGFIIIWAGLRVLCPMLGLM